MTWIGMQKKKLLEEVFGLKAAKIDFFIVHFHTQLCENERFVFNALWQCQYDTENTIHSVRKRKGLPSARLFSSFQPTSRPPGR